MKKFGTIVLLVSSVFYSSILLSQITPTNNFQKLSVADGLVNDSVTDIYVENSSNIWIATRGGLSHFDGTVFTNYTAATSGLNSDNIKELEYCQNKIWMITANGISSFDGTTFVNYTTTNGLLSSDILGIAATSTDTLWMTSTNGTSKFDGSTFTDYPSQTGRDIETDSLDRVYVMRVNAAGNFSFARLYENGIWSLPTFTGDYFYVTDTKLIKTASNKLYVGAKLGTFASIDYPLNCNLKRIYIDSSLYNQSSMQTLNSQQLEEHSGLRWIGAGTGASFYYVGADSNYLSQYVRDPYAASSCIKATKNLLIIGSSRGLYYTTPTIKSSRNEIEFAVNQIKTTVTTIDPLFSDLPRNTPNFEFPKNNNSHGIYAANFIVAAKKLTQSNYEVHPINAFGQAFSSGPRFSIGGLANDFIVRVTRQEILTHQTNFNQSGYSMSDGIKNWPAAGDTSLGMAIDLAPFFDANSNGCYDPSNGDYPIIKGDEAIYWINHPTNQNLELEYHWMLYAFDDTTNQSLDQSVFVQYTIVNRAIEVYDSLKVGFFLDGDLGNPTDDYVGCDSLNNIYYFYNGDTFDESRNGNSGYGNNTPALGVKFLSDSLTNLMYYNNSNGNNGDPQTVQHWLGYMNSIWKNGRQLRYGGDGFDINSSAVSSIPTTHMFTGNPTTQTGWTESNPGGGLAPNPPGDRRLFGSMPYFSLQPNERKTIEIVLGYGATPSAVTAVGQNVSTMISLLNQAGTSWNTINLPTATFSSTDTCRVTSVSEVDFEITESLQLFPVPTSSSLQIVSTIKFDNIQLFDMKGAFVKRIAPSAESFIIDVSNLKEGIYFLKAVSGSTTQSKKFVVMR